MNDLGSHEFKPLDDMNISGMYRIWRILYHVLKVVHDMKDFKSWAHDSRYYEELKVVDDMNQFELWA